MRALELSAVLGQIGEILNALDWVKVAVAIAVVSAALAALALIVQWLAWRRPKADPAVTKAIERQAVATERLNEFLGGLLTTPNLPLRRQFEEARASQERAAKEQHFPQKKADLEEAIQGYRLALGLGPKPSERAALLVLIGNALLYLSRLEGAEDSYREALSAADGMEDASEKKMARAATLSNLGIVYRQKGDLDKALEHCGQVLSIDGEIGNRLGEAQALGNLGNVYIDKGDLDKALEHYEQALAIAREIGHRLGEANTLGNLGNVCAQKGEMNKALEHFEQALRIFEAVGAMIEAETARGNIEELKQRKGKA